MFDGRFDRALAYQPVDPLREHPMHAFRFAIPLAALAMAACQQVQPAAATAQATPAAAASVATDATLLARGEYLVKISGCNDCHTPGYAESGGQVPKPQWLVGSPLGWHGPWGTTSAANLRLKLQDMDEAAWLKYSAELHTRPPMPDFAVRDMQEDDRRAIYHFIRALGPGGQAAPAYLPPNQAPQPPYVDWVLPPGPPVQAKTAG
jgi:mono/diheme cytochrome c family protein